MGYNWTNNWPGSETVYPSMDDHVDQINHTYFSGLHQEIKNVESTLGLSPQGAYASVVARLNAKESEFSGGISGINTILGTSPQDGYADVVTRLNAMDAYSEKLFTHQYRPTDSTFELFGSGISMAKLDTGHQKVEAIAMPDAGATEIQYNGVIDSERVTGKYHVKIYYSTENNSGGARVGYTIYLFTTGDDICAGTGHAHTGYLTVPAVASKYLLGIASFDINASDLDKYNFFEMSFIRDGDNVLDDLVSYFYVVAILIEEYVA